ncbi:ACT domain-containing protein, partial [Duncaniella freteri]|uniref:ACT domain-containing protein n=1 Tax=Duncaniella freteri TaxID=2530391 RepID=UPI00336BE77B
MRSFLTVLRNIRNKEIMEKKMFTIAVFTENQVGLLNRISIIFTRRGINLESVSSSPSSVSGVHK